MRQRCESADSEMPSTVRLKDPIHKPLLVGSFGVHMVANEDALVLRFMR